MKVEAAVLNDEKVKAEIAKLELPKGTVVVCDPWIYGEYDRSLLRSLFD